MSKSNTFENDLLKLIAHGTTIANLADNAASSPLTSLFATIHTADPGEAGTQSTNEVAYTGFARQAISRDSSGLTVSGNTIVPVDDILFPVAPSGSTQTATHWSLGVAVSGATKILYSGALSPTIAIAEGVEPRIGTFNISED
jgi:hypothetical protein